MASFINFSRSKRGSTQTGSSSPSLGRASVQSQRGRVFYFRLRSIRSTMTPDKLLQCFRDDYRSRISLRPLVPGPLSEPEAVPELSAVASLGLVDSEHMETSLLSSVILIDDEFNGFTNLYEPSEPPAVE